MFLRLTSRRYCSKEFTDLDQLLRSRRSKKFKLMPEKNEDENIKAGELKTDSQVNSSEIKTDDIKKKMLMARRRKFMSPGLRIQNMMKDNVDEK